LACPTPLPPSLAPPISPPSPLGDIIGALAGNGDPLKEGAEPVSRIIMGALDLGSGMEMGGGLILGCRLGEIEGGVVGNGGAPRPPIGVRVRVKVGG